MSASTPRFRAHELDIPEAEPLGVAQVLPQPAREALVAAAQMRNPLFLEQTLTMIRRKYSAYFKQGDF